MLKLNITLSLQGCDRGASAAIQEDEQSRQDKCDEFGKDFPDDACREAIAQKKSAGRCRRFVLLISCICICILAVCLQRLRPLR